MYSAILEWLSEAARNQLLYYTKREIETMPAKLKVALASLSIIPLLSAAALADTCILGVCINLPGLPGPTPVPEINGAAGLAAMALVASVAAVAYRKIRR